MISLLVSLLIFVIIAGLVWWIISAVPIDPVFKRVCQVIVVIILLVILIGYLSGGFNGRLFHP